MPSRGTVLLELGHSTLNIEFNIEFCDLGSKRCENIDRSSEETAGRGGFPQAPCPINLEVLSCFQFSSLPMITAQVLEPSKETLSPCSALILVSVSLLSGLLGAAHQCCLHMSFATIICVFWPLWWCPCTHGHSSASRGVWLCGTWPVLPCRAMSVCSVSLTDCSQMSLWGCVPEQVPGFSCLFFFLFFFSSFP